MIFFFSKTKTIARFKSITSLLQDRRVLWHLSLLIAAALESCYRPDHPEGYELFRNYFASPGGWRCGRHKVQRGCATPVCQKNKTVDSPSPRALFYLPLLCLLFLHRPFEWSFFSSYSPPLFPFLCFPLSATAEL